MKKINLIIVLGLVSISALAQDTLRISKNDLFVVKIYSNILKILYFLRLISIVCKYNNYKDLNCKINCTHNPNERIAYIIGTIDYSIQLQEQAVNKNNKSNI